MQLFKRHKYFCLGLLLSIVLFTSEKAYGQTPSLPFPIINPLNPFQNLPQSFDLGDPTNLNQTIVYDPETGTTKWWHYDADKDEAKIETVFEVGDLIEQNKKQYASTDERARYGEWSKVASIPMALFYRLKNEGIVDDPKRMKAWLNDRDNQLFRTRPGRV